MTSRVLVTGAAGFFGSHLCRTLVENRYGVLGLVRSGSDLRRLQSLARFMEIVRVDRNTDFSAILAGEPFEAVVHAATNYGRDTREHSKLVRDNMLLPLEILEALDRKDDEAVFINTDSFFSKEEESSDYLRPYSTSKRQLLTWLTLAPPRRAIVNVYMEHMYGPDDSPGKFVPWLFSQLLSAHAVIELTEGKNRRDFVFVHDAVMALMKLIEQAHALPRCVTTYQVGSGEATSVRDFVELAHAISCSDAVLRFGAVSARPKEIAVSCADTSAIRRLGWTPTTSLADGIRICFEALTRGTS